MNPAPLFTLYRDRIPEVQVHGEVCVVSGNKIVFQSSEVLSSFPARSLLKPFQFAATELIQSGVNKSDWHVAALGSISATVEQVTELRNWVQRQKLEGLLSHLVLPASFPMDETHRVQLKTSGDQPNVFYHTCFSKHLAILKLCELKKWPGETYASQEHPYHAALTRFLEDTIKEKPGVKTWVKDGCGLPSPVLRIDQLAKLFQLLVAAKNGDPLNTIRDLMLENPNWIGSGERVDTCLMTDNPGCVIAKEGADGMLAVGILPNKRYPDGLGIVIKVASGYLPNLAALALGPVFEECGIKSRALVPQGQTVSYHYDLSGYQKETIRDLSPLLNSAIAVWPGDVKFTTENSHHVNQGDHLSLSAISTSVHVGSHTDAPIHFVKGGKAIDQVELDKYYGPCQVVEVDVPPHEEIRLTHLQGQSILCQRILFKTNSCPDSKSFNTDFVGLSVEVIEFLAERGVRLVGIDTPSIDLFESKELKTHHATNRLGMAILEGVDLSKVPSGFYKLIALPLRLENADASPVRAVLISRENPFGF